MLSLFSASMLAFASNHILLLLTRVMARHDVQNRVGLFTALNCKRRASDVRAGPLTPQGVSACLS